MPTKFVRTSFSTVGYAAMDPTINGRATVTFANISGVNLKIAGEADTAPAIGTTVYAQISSNSAAVYSFDCNPAKTWLAAGSGGGTLEIAIQY
jgi:hypothetical protein